MTLSQSLLVNGPIPWTCYRGTCNYVIFPPTQNVELKVTPLSEWVFAVTKLFNTAVNDFDVKKAIHYSRVLVVTEPVVAGVQCITNAMWENCEKFFLVQVLVDYTPYVPDRPRGRPPGSRKNKHPRKPLVVTKKNKV